MTDSLTTDSSTTGTTNVIGLIGRLSAKVSDMSLAVRCAWLNGTLFVVFSVAMLVAAFGENASMQMVAVATAAAICTLSANAALVLSVLWHGTPSGVVGALGGSLVGMFPPLFAGFILHKRGGALAQAGIFGWIVVFYLAALLVKTLLVAPATAKQSATKPAAGGSNTENPACGAGV